MERERSAIVIEEAREENTTHEELDPVETPLSLVALDQIDEPPWGSDEDMGPLAKLNRLCHHVHPADNDRRVKVDRRSDDTELLRDLEGEFTVGERP